MYIYFTFLYFFRIKSGNPGYLVAFNLNPNSTVVDLTILRGVPGDVSLIAHSATPGVNVTIPASRLVWGYVYVLKIKFVNTRLN